MSNKTRYYKKDFNTKSTILWMLLLLILCLPAYGNTQLEIEGDQIIFTDDNGVKIKITNSEGNKYLPVIEPNNKQLIAYHIDINRASIPSTFINIINVKTGETVNQIPINEHIRKILSIDWLSSSHLGIHTWNRGISSKFIILNVTNGETVREYNGRHFALSNNKKKLVFQNALPGGYVPDEIKTELKIFGVDFSIKDFNKENINPKIIYSERSFKESIDLNKMTWNEKDNIELEYDYEGEIIKKVISGTF